MTHDKTLATVRRVLDEHRHVDGALLPILHAVQDALGSVPADVVPVIADALNLSRAEVHGVISYYHDFHSIPAPHRLQICRAESCQALGGEELLAHARRHLGCGEFDASDDGAFSVEPVYCLGLCSLSPALSLNGRVHARMTPKKLDALVAREREAKEANA